jgi:ribonucleotide reductase alpha subunit
MLHSAIDTRAKAMGAHSPRVLRLCRTPRSVCHNVIDVSQFPLPQQRARAQGSRRIGLGITGLADALLMLGLNYGDERARNAAAELMRMICHSAYRTSVALAKEKSPFLIRKVLDRDGHASELQLTDYALSSWRTLVASATGLPPGFTTASQLSVGAHLDMQASLQPYVDNSISKTINVSQDLSFDEFSRIYDLAYDKGLKGCTTFRPNPITGTVLSETGDGTDAPHCCVLEREAD